MEELQAHVRDEEKQDSRMKVVGKDKIKAKLSGKSPDWSDSWFLTFYAESQRSQDEFRASLRDIISGRVDAKDLSNYSPREIMDKFSEYYEDDNSNDHDKWIDDLMNGDAKW